MNQEFILDGKPLGRVTEYKHVRVTIHSNLMTANKYRMKLPDVPFMHSCALAFKDITD